MRQVGAASVTRVSPAGVAGVGTVCDGELKLAGAVTVCVAGVTGMPPSGEADLVVVGAGNIGSASMADVRAIGESVLRRWEHPPSAAMLISSTRGRRGTCTQRGCGCVAPDRGGWCAHGGRGTSTSGGNSRSAYGGRSTCAQLERGRSALGSCGRCRRNGAYLKRDDSGTMGKGRQYFPDFLLRMCAICENVTASTRDLDRFHTFSNDCSIAG